MTQTIRNSISALHEEITAYRHSLHENPGTAYEEEFASNLVKEKLTAWGITFESEIAVTGIVATIEGQSNSSGKSIGIRADMDALDILEADNKPHRSKIDGKMHGCGHDGHTSILLGVAKYLSENNNFDGTAHLIFQPAEEGQGGAHKMIEEGLFDRFPCDEVYALHNWPEISRGQIAMKSGPIMAAADRFELTITGKGGHAAMPQATVDPIVIGSQIVSALQTLISRSVTPTDPAVITITNFKAGTGAFNVIPETAYLSGTLRTFNQETRTMLKTRIAELAEQTAQSYGASTEIWFDPNGYDPTINSPAPTDFCIDVAQQVFGADNVDTNPTPCMGAEDFGAMSEAVPGCYVWVGQGEDEGSNHSQGLHTPQYDFNDAIIPSAIEFFVRVTEQALPIK